MRVLKRVDDWHAGDTYTIQEVSLQNHDGSYWYRSKCGVSSGLPASDLELVSAGNLTGETKVKTIMTSIKTFVKEMGLTADEKVLRKAGLKTDCGDYTQDAIDVVLQAICKEKETELVEIAKGLIEEQTKAK